MRIVNFAAAGVAAAVLLAGCSTEPAAEPTSASPSPTPASSAPVPSDPNEALQSGVQSGDVDAVNAALAAGADPNLEFGAGVTALIAAIQRDDAQLVEAIIDGGADLELANRENRTPLTIAAGIASGEVVQVLLDAGATIEVFSDDVYNASPLHAAAQGRNPEALKVLVTSGVDINLANPGYGATALHACAWWNCVDCATVLYEAGADLSLREDGGDTALTVARNRHSDETALFLESVGAPE